MVRMSISPATVIDHAVRFQRKSKSPRAISRRVRSCFQLEICAVVLLTGIGNDDMDDNNNNGSRSIYSILPVFTYLSWPLCPVIAHGSFVQALLSLCFHVHPAMTRDTQRFHSTLRYIMQAAVMPSHGVGRKYSRSSREMASRQQRLRLVAV